MPRIPKKYLEHARVLLRQNHDGKEPSEGDVASLAKLLHSTRALEAPKPTLTGMLIVSFEKDEMGNAEVGLGWDFVDGKNHRVTPGADFAKWLLAQAKEVAEQQLPSDDD